MPIKLTNKNVNPKTIKGVDCKIGSYYRRESEPDKVYLCSRDVSRDVREWRNQSHVLIREGNMLVSMRHGNRMTANMEAKDFIEVEVTATYKDVQ